MVHSHVNSLTLRFVYARHNRCDSALPAGLVAFVHDDDDKFPLYRSAYLAFRKKNPKTAKQMGRFRPLNDEEHPPLQAADLAANVTCNYAKQWLEDRTEASMERLKESVYMIGIWKKAYIMSVLRKQK